MNVTMRQLQCFVEVASCRSFAEACRNMHLSQPALSIAIKNLEQAIGGQLLERSTRSVVLTPEGREFYPSALRLLEDWEQSLEDVSNLFSLQRGRLVIAAMPTFAGTLLPQILARFHQQYPAINITVQDVVAEQVVDMVLNGRVELGITFDPGEVDDIEFTPLFRDRFVAVFPPGHPLLKRKSVHWQDFQDSSFITLQRPSSIRRQVLDTLQAQNVPLVPAFEAHQLVVVGRMVAEGLGVSVIPEISAGQMAEMGAECRQLTPEISRNIGIVLHQRRSRSAVSDSIIEVIRDWAENRHKMA